MEHRPIQETNASRRRPVRTILAVGRDRTALNELTQRLGNLGFLVVVSDPGGPALELIAARGVDLVLIDCGREAPIALHTLQEIRSARETADLPALVLLAGDDADLALRALRFGADDCLAPPLPFELLVARLERTLARAARLEELKRSNLALDARLAARAMELGEARAELAAARTDRLRLMTSVRALHDQLDLLQGA